MACSPFVGSSSSTSSGNLWFKARESDTRKTQKGKARPGWLGVLEDAQARVNLYDCTVVDALQ